MTIQLTDAQIARVLELCGKISDLQKRIPAVPAGFKVEIEVAQALRSAMEESNDTLLELGALLR